MNDEDIPDEPVVLPIEDSLDLHTFRPSDIRSVVEEYLRECRSRGFCEVRIIHGKGIGVQREIVHGVLSRSADVASYRLASHDAGHWGATIVFLLPPSGET